MTLRCPLPLRRLTVGLVACLGLGACAALFGGSGGGGDGLFGVATALACPELASSSSALGRSFTADAQLNAKIGAFVQASKDLVAVSREAELEVQRACQAMGRDLGLTEEAMLRADGPGGRAKGACAALAAEIDGILRGAGDLRVEAQMTPPRCEIDITAKGRCEATCEVEADPGAIVASCSPAKLSGRCEGTCAGRCEGTCSGSCAGTCSRKDAQGRCAGKCSGECRGQCAGACYARCEGTWRAPRCEGSVRPPSADADCRAACDARAEITGICTPPQLTLMASAEVAMVGKLLATATTHVPALLVTQFKLGKRAAGQIQALGKLGAGLQGKLDGAGKKAAACVSAAAAAVAEASVSVSVTVQVSASVSGKVGAGV